VEGPGAVTVLVYFVAQAGPPASGSTCRSRGSGQVWAYNPVNETF